MRRSRIVLLLLLMLASGCGRGSDEGTNDVTELPNLSLEAVESQGRECVNVTVADSRYGPICNIDPPPPYAFMLLAYRSTDAGSELNVYVVANSAIEVWTDDDAVELQGTATS